MSNTTAVPEAYPLGRVALAVLFITAGITHFIVPAYFIAIVPPALPRPDLLVAVSGAAEIAGGLGLLIRRARRIASWGLLALLVAVFPANIQMLRNWLATGRGGWYELALWIRLPLQLLLGWWVWRCGSEPGLPDTGRSVHA